MNLHIHIHIYRKTHAHITNIYVNTYTRTHIYVNICMFASAGLDSVGDGGVDANILWEQDSIFCSNATYNQQHYCSRVRKPRVIRHAVRAPLHDRSVWGAHGKRCGESYDASTAHLQRRMRTHVHSAQCCEHYCHYNQAVGGSTIEGIGYYGVCSHCHLHVTRRHSESHLACIPAKLPHACIHPKWPVALQWPLQCKIWDVRDDIRD